MSAAASTSNLQVIKSQAFRSFSCCRSQVFHLLFPTLLAILTDLVKVGLVLATDNIIATYTANWKDHL